MLRILNDKALKYVDKEKYLGIIMSENCKSENDMHRQMRSIYGRDNMVIRNFKQCSDSVKVQLFNTFCGNFYCSHLWSMYTKSSYAKVKVAFKKIYRSLMKLDRRCSITGHMVNLNVDSFDVLIRKSVYNFKERLYKSDNVLIRAVVNSMFFWTVLCMPGGLKFYSNTYYYLLVIHVYRPIYISLICTVIIC